ncbi:hypothetical protein ABIE27_003807 [Paenibacillus sp. 4624]|jgi:hypothetical protein|uniref:Uncharacterized protein n=1 Tax=Paenibacillus amylolyticus TaxID=1451 RepID=A0A5M9WUP0_PAEAM|nr:hypothetical protein [Paenibacillus amylolyticus]KAA8785397.1 hypothetical protein EC604_16255 [Paenibacillus amylolyticus]
MDQYDNVFLLLLSFIGLIWTVKGIKKKLRLMVFFGVILMLAPVLVITGRMVWLPLVSSVALVSSLIVRKDVNRTKL